MSAEYSVKEVREYAKVLRDKCNLTGWGVMADMLDNLAERIEADESAVPVAEVFERPVHHDLHNSPMMKDIRFTGMPLPIGAKLYANPHSPDAADSGRVADASAEDRFEQYVKTLIDHAPDVQKLGERLAHLLDDDQFNNIEPTLLGIAAALSAQGQGEARHPDDDAVDAFAAAMKEKLAAARAKGRGGWQDKNDCPQQRLSDMLRAHVAKGDPCDVANFCMFLHQRGEAIMPNESGRNIVCQLAFGERDRDPRDGPRVISWNEMPYGTYQLCLATAPPASPAGVPDARTEMDYEYDAEGLLDPYDSGHMAGWNDCRKVMLAAPSATPEGGEADHEG